MLKFILVLMTAYLIYSLHKEIKVHQVKWKTILATVSFLIIGIGVGVDSQQTHYSPTDVQSMQQKYMRVKEEEWDAKDKHASLIERKSKAFDQFDSARSAYTKKQPQFKKEAYQKKRAKEQKKEQQDELQRQQKNLRKQQVQAAKQRQVVQAQQSEDPKNRTVWIAPKSGTKYHYNPDCPGLNRAESEKKMTEQQAIAEGYKLCKFEGGH